MDCMIYWVFYLFLETLLKLICCCFNKVVVYGNGRSEKEVG